MFFEYEWQDQSLDNGPFSPSKLLFTAHLRSQTLCFNSYPSSSVDSQHSSPSHNTLVQITLKEVFAAAAELCGDFPRMLAQSVHLRRFVHFAGVFAGLLD
jgi:hypothetical protein